MKLKLYSPGARPAFCRCDGKVSIGRIGVGGAVPACIFRNHAGCTLQTRDRNEHARGKLCKGDDTRGEGTLVAVRRARASCLKSGDQLIDDSN